ncbi:fumarate/nitrate reduction transcriptional regulator Fnr [Marinobacter orientalis]|uniref:Fumarate/nitrate reduction transcriptional regulator Fnr n=1 Tax=Marinobacter orientalis TaxID=1928859 RepID=A0A7Y0WSS5_9GAMM|nr:fumarate/nitrate reduction transcriptional regulator Fnr [Marinobacter orientalis]NMT64091.1 fumarate/nitrate reduction transcriptional regulator Fnr [Marinobacter orientalis]TGX49323.1 fumarate/nitrate reduction transcriptional regulator Fnr [Marinobacter orientalis]
MAQPIRLHQVSPLKASCHQCSLSNLCLPLAVEDNELYRLEDIVQQGRIFSRGEHIFDQSTPFRSCFAVKSGAIKTSIISENGEEQVTGFFMPGELVGLDSMGSKNYACTAKALERTSVCEFPVDRLEELTAKLPDLQHHVYHLMSQEIQGSHQLAMLLSKNTAEERIAALLLSLSSRFHRRRMSGTNFSLPMARNDIANFLGLAVETVSRVFTRFQNQGIISARGREVELLDVEALQTVTREFSRQNQ